MSPATTGTTGTRRERVGRKAGRGRRPRRVSSGGAVDTSRRPAPRARGRTSRPSTSAREPRNDSRSLSSSRHSSVNTCTLSYLLTKYWKCIYLRKGALLGSHLAMPSLACGRPRNGPGAVMCPDSFVDCSTI